VKAVLADARAGRKLVPGEWSMLAFYSWETDEDQVAATAERARLLATLAQTCPAGNAKTRLMLKALAAQDAKSPAAGPAARKKVLEVLGDPAAARRQMDVLTGSAPEIVKALEPKPGASRRQLMKAFNSSLKRLEADATLSRADQLGALLARVDLAADRPAEGHVTAEDLGSAARRSAPPRGPRRPGDHERIRAPGGAHRCRVHAGARGLWKESDELLQANLAKSHSPYYLMSQLADNARKRGDNEKRCTGTPRRTRRARDPRRACNGARAISARSSISRRRTRRASRRPPRRS
jgi:hypothetical protein